MSKPSPISVLLVDDQPVYHDLVVHLLERDPDIIVVGVASTADEALAQVRACRPEVVVMDQQLPDGHGTDVAERIAKGFWHARVVMLTASADEHTVQAARRSGCSAYVTKDRVVRDIVAAVKGAYRGETIVPGDLEVFLGFGPGASERR
ncbi:MAG: response regulator transcription factor [Actinomycetota bacterium]|nr:response regulator transcription factor [Actinomycetota bacterium]